MMSSSSSSVAGGPVKKLKFNEHGLPIGDKANSATRLGQLARTAIPICYGAWPDVPERYKDQLWAIFKEEYPDLKESQRSIFMKKSCDAWKKFKGNLRATYLIGNDVAQWKSRVPTKIKSEDWEIFCDNEINPKQQELRKQNKEIRKNCDRKSTHNTGRDGYARAAEKWELKHGRPPNRAELWLDTHMTKDGNFAPYDQEFADKIIMLLDVFRENNEEETLDSGPLYETFGQDMRGRVIAVGPISRKAMMSSAFAREMLKEVNTDRNEWKSKVDDLKEQVEGLTSMFQEFRKDFKDGKFSNVDNTVNTISKSATPTSIEHSHSTSQFTNISDLTMCEIKSYTGEIVGRGRKSKIGAATTVHGHILGPREVRVILDSIKKPEYTLWGGNQGFCSTLVDVGVGGIIFWHDDFLPPVGDV